MIHCYFEFVALQYEKNHAVLNFTRFDSLVCIVARSREKSRSLSLVPFLTRYRSLSLSLPGLADCEVVPSLLEWWRQKIYFTNVGTLISKQNINLRWTLATKPSPTRTFCIFRSPCMTGWGWMECRYSIPHTTPWATNSFFDQSIWNEIHKLDSNCCRKYKDHSWHYH